MKVWVWVFLCGVWVLGCTKREAVTVGGSTTILPIVSKVADQFRMQHSDVRIIVNAGGSGVGIKQVGEGKIDMGMASRALTELEMETYKDAHLQVHVLARDAVVPVVSSEVYDAGVTVLTLVQIGQIYTGEIDNWKILGGPDREILVIDKEKSRGTRHVFMAQVLGDKEADAPGADLVLGSNNEEQTAIVQSDAAIGLLSHAWLNEGVKGLAIRGNGDVIEPTHQNIINGSFPITRDLLVVTRGEPVGVVKAFVDYLLSAEGQRIVEASGYVAVR
jgi:phosphate transport system substrate-binding protein